MIGYHISKHSINYTYKTLAEPLTDAVNKLAEFKHICSQMFIMGPQSFKSTITSDDINNCAKIIRDHSITAFVHGSYLDRIFSDNRGVIHFIKQELYTCAQLGAHLIVHLSAEANVDTNLSRLHKYDKPELTNTKIYFEINSAKSGENSFETPEKLGAVFERLIALKLNHLKFGLVVDTAHLYACGIALTTREQAENWFKKLRKYVINKYDIPIMIHLNDNSLPLGCGRDKHEALTYGNIWGDYNIKLDPLRSLNITKSGLCGILDFATKYYIPCILERHSSDVAKDLALLDKLGFSK